MIANGDLLDAKQENPKHRPSGLGRRAQTLAGWQELP
jgi:hypothetical protein